MRFLASAGAVLLVLVTALAGLVWVLVERGFAWVLAREKEGGRRFANDAPLRHAALWVASSTALIVLAGLALTGVWSVSGLWRFPDALPLGLDLSGWSNAAHQMARPVWTSIVTALLASGLSLAVTVFALRHLEGRTASPLLHPVLLYMPLIVPQAAFLFGLQILLLAASVPVSLVVLALAHAVFVLPYMFISLSGPWQGFDSRYEQIGFGLGHSSWTVFWYVRLAMMLRPLMTTVAVGFAVSVALYLPTLLIGAGRLPTVTTEAVALASGGNRRTIGVYAFMQTLLPFAAFAAATLVPALIFANRRAMRH